MEEIAAAESLYFGIIVQNLIPKRENAKTFFVFQFSLRIFAGV